MGRKNELETPVMWTKHHKSLPTGRQGLVVEILVMDKRTGDVVVPCGGDATDYTELKTIRGVLNRMKRNNTVRNFKSMHKGQYVGFQIVSYHNDDSKTIYYREYFGKRV